MLYCRCLLRGKNPNDTGTYWQIMSIYYFRASSIDSLHVFAYYCTDELFTSCSQNHKINILQRNFILSCSNRNIQESNMTKTADESVSDDDSVMDCESSEEFASSEESRDEKAEVYKMSAKDTFRVKLWRAAVTVVLLLTALAVTLTTYKFLKADETDSFKTAVSVQFLTLPFRSIPFSTRQSTNSFMIIISDTV